MLRVIDGGARFSAGRRAPGQDKSGAAVRHLPRDVVLIRHARRCTVAYSERY